MNQELTEEQSERIRDFVTALRSGEYQQTGNQLATETPEGRRYCCEGVAVERYGEQLGFDVAWRPTPISVPVNAELTIDRHAEYAEDNFWEAMGLSTGIDNGASTVFAFVLPPDQDVRDTGAEAAAYMALNDDGLTFEQIADLIEWQFLS
jgi:hypothetical protein